MVEENARLVAGEYMFGSYKCSVAYRICTTDALRRTDAVCRTMAVEATCTSHSGRIPDRTRALTILQADVPR